ncbi:LuxR family two component transcriptional regulator [Luteimonas cucumeris]|uniref:LuxR family two component transcriptional regulator n=1 Tax=Luteimonas cucumeris TaxID=985012 RepID=A0A562L2F3_9GAMM|nr:response regulator transcription factor [Luteimonas cucumeris]TWI01644.1 LuxR family two component transcriptional regulator [Luteimonas cucumeris]
MEPQPISLASILIVEDDRVSRQRLVRLLADFVDADARIQDAADLATARTLLQTMPFTLALVDVQLPDGNGIDLIAWMQQHAPQTVSVIVSAWAEEETILAAVKAGAIGYLLKDRDDDELRVSLKSLQRGGAPIDPTIARRILALLPQAALAETPAAPASTQLSEREREILKLVAQGFSNREIAELVSLSKLTIECHTRNIYRKLAVGSRTAAVFEARSMGLLS